MSFVRSGVRQVTVIIRTLTLDDNAHGPHDLMDVLPRRMSEAFSFMTNLRSLRLELDWFTESQMQDLHEQLRSKNVRFSNLRSLRVSPPSILEDIIKYCDNEVLKTLDLKGCLQPFELEEAKKIKNLERLHLTFLKPEGRSSTWAWARSRRQILRTLREPQFSGLKWLTVHWEQERDNRYSLSLLYYNKTRVIREVTKVARALPHLERLVITFQEACGLSPSVCRAEDLDGNKSLTRKFVRKVENLKEFWIVSSCYAHGAYSRPDGRVVSTPTSVCNMDPEDPVFPWSRHKE